MKKILTALLLVFVLESVSFAASSNDVYVRQDVFDAKMDLLFTKIDALETKMDAKFDALESRLNAKIDVLDARITNIENNVSWWIGGLTLFLTGLALIPLIWALVEKFRKPLITLDDVRRLISEELSKLSPVSQVR